MTMPLLNFREPDLEFRYNQHLPDPRHGLSLFGPFDSDLPSAPRHISYIVIGSNTGIGAFERWSAAMNRPTVSTTNLQLWPPFPGYDAAFGSAWAKTPSWSYSIDDGALALANNVGERHERAFKVVDLYLEGLQQTEKLDESFQVAICVVPDAVWQNCRPKSYVYTPKEERISKRMLRARKQGQLELLSKFDPDEFKLSPDFRRQLKAGAMRFGIPIQILRESRLHLHPPRLRS